MLITANSIDKIMEASNIEDIIPLFVDLKKKGVNLTGKCPFHDEKTESFSVSATKQIYKCFGCGKAGNVVNFLMESQKYTYPDALKYLAQHYHIEVEYEEQSEKQKEAESKTQSLIKILKEADDRYFIPNKSQKAYIEYFEKRAISEDILIEWGIGFAPMDFKGLSNLFIREAKFSIAEDAGICHKKADQCYDTLINRITIPIKNRMGEIIGFAGRYVGDDDKQAKYLNPKDTYIYNKQRVLFGMDKAAKSIAKMGFAIVTEGYFDVIGCHAVGLTNTVASCGTALTEGHINILKRATNNIYLMYDGDKAGKNATLKSITLLLKENLNVSVIDLEEGVDPFDWSQKVNGSDAIKELNLLKSDAIVWAADYLIGNIGDGDIDKRDKAIDTICSLLVLVSDYKCGELIKMIANEGYVTAALLKKRCAKLGKEIVKELKEGKTGKQVLPSEVDESEFEQYGFFENKGMYWGMTGNGGKYAVSNFTMDILWHVKTGGEEAFRMIKIKNIHGYEATINMNTDDFVSLSSFKKLIARRGNYLWKGKEEDLTKLQDKLQREERQTEFIDVLGFHPRGNFYAFSNGIIDLNKIGEDVNVFLEADEHGIIKHLDKNFFIPSGSKMYADKEDLFYNYKKFIYMKRNYELKKWFELFEKAYGDNGKIGFIYYTASIFSDIVYKEMGRRFPILNLYGQRGSGKGTFAESLLCLFGEPQEQIMLGGNTTQVGFMRTFAQFRNSIVWLDEYKNNLNKRVIEAIKNIYDRIGYKRGKKDHSFEVDYVPVQSACILSGQEMPTIEPALFTRVIMLTFKETKHTEESRASFRELKAEQENGLSHLTVHLLQYRTAVAEKFKSFFEEEVKAIEKEVNNGQVEERMINNYACLSAMCRVILEHETLGFKPHGFRSLLVKNISIQHAVLQGSDDTTKFWQVVESLYSQNLISEGKDFELADRKLFIKIQNIAGLYEKEMRMRNDPNALQKSTLENYLQIDKSKYIGRVRKSFTDGSYTWCLVFDYISLEINLIRKKDGMTYEDVKAKYMEMGIDTMEGVTDSPPSDVPEADKLKPLPF